MTHPLYDELIRALGGLPARGTIDAVHLETVRFPSYRREKYLLVCDRQRFIPLYLLLPNTSQPRPGILAFHQHAGQYHLGKSEPVGLMGDPKMNYAHRLAEHGYVVAAWDCIGFEERYDASFGSRYEHFLAMKAIAEGRCLEQEYILDAMYVADFLESRPEVADGPLGCIGHSLGGQNVLFLLLLDDRVKVGVSSCGIGTIQSFIEQHVTHNFAWYVPGLLPLGDTPRLAELLASKSLLISQGTRDPIFPMHGVQAFAAAASRVATVETYFFDGEHSFPDEAFERAIRFLANHLGQE